MNPAERLEFITKELQHHTSDPHWLAEIRLELAGLYSYFSGQLEQILFTKPKAWNEMRGQFKSDKACDRAWEATEDGLKEVIFRSRQKRIEKLMASLGTMLRLLEGEAKYQVR